MEIECPHCKIAFEGSKCVLKERKHNYRWYEFTGKASHCPHCGERYQADLSKVGFLSVLLFTASVAFLTYFDYELFALPIFIIAYFVCKKYHKEIIRVTAIKAT